MAKQNRLTRNLVYEEVVANCTVDDTNLYVRLTNGMQAYPLDGCKVTWAVLGGKTQLKLRDIAWMLAHGPLEPGQAVTQTVEGSLRPEHLEVSSRTDRMMKTRTVRSNTGFRGVTRGMNRNHEAFMASICVNGKVIRVAHTRDLSEAIAARRGWERRLYGAELEPPDEDPDSLLAFEAESIKKLKKFSDTPLEALLP